MIRAVIFNESGPYGSHYAQPPPSCDGRCKWVINENISHACFYSAASATGIITKQECSCQPPSGGQWTMDRVYLSPSLIEPNIYLYYGSSLLFVLSLFIIIDRAHYNYDLQVTCICSGNTNTLLLFMPIKPLKLKLTETQQAKDGKANRKSERESQIYCIIYEDTCKFTTAHGKAIVDGGQSFVFLMCVTWQWHSSRFL